MNAQSIWAGHEYAYYNNRPKGVNFSRHGVVRITVIKIEKVREWSGSQRATTMVKGTLDDGRTVTVKARDIIGFWDDYAEQLAVVMEREAEQERERARIREVEALRKERVITLLTSLGFEREDITFNNYDSSRITLKVQRTIDVLDALEVEVGSEST